MTKVPAWFWIFAILGTLWDCIGCYAYWADVTMDAETLAALPDYSQIIHNQRPIWATAGFAIATWGGLLGMVLLLMRRRVAVPVLLVSLLALAVDYAWPALFSGQMGRLTPADWPLMIAIPVIQIGLCWLALHARKKGWLG